MNVIWRWKQSQNKNPHDKMLKNASPHSFFVVLFEKEVSRKRGVCTFAFPCSTYFLFFVFFCLIRSLVQRFDAGRWSRYPEFDREKCYAYPCTRARPTIGRRTRSSYTARRRAGEHFLVGLLDAPVQAEHINLMDIDTDTKQRGSPSRAWALLSWERDESALFCSPMIAQAQSWTMDS
jgi:hypothetical protein